MSDQQGQPDLGAELAADHDAAFPRRTEAAMLGGLAHLGGAGGASTFTVGGSGTVQAQAPAVVTCTGGVTLRAPGGGAG